MTRVIFGDVRLCHVCEGRGKKTTRVCLACDGTGIEGRTRAELVDVGRAERDAALDRVDQVDAPWGVDAARWFAAQTPASTFVAGDLTRAIGQPASRPAVGSAFQLAARRGIIERVGVAPSDIPDSHASIVGVWRRTWRVAK